MLFNSSCITWYFFVYHVKAEYVQDYEAQSEQNQNKIS